MITFSLFLLSLIGVSFAHPQGNRSPTTVSYNILKYPQPSNSLELAKMTDKALENAINLWQPVVPFTLKRKMDDLVDIKIKFIAKNSLDCSAQLDLIAHTHMPHREQPFGTIHLDQDAHWTPLKLERVLAHEIGHAFGLTHIQGGLMSSQYLPERVEKKPELSKKDIQAVRDFFREKLKPFMSNPNEI